MQRGGCVARDTNDFKKGAFRSSHRLAKGIFGRYHFLDELFRHNHMTNGSSARGVGLLQAASAKDGNTQRNEKLWRDFVNVNLTHSLAGELHVLSSWFVIRRLRTRVGDRLHPWDCLELLGKRALKCPPGLRKGVRVSEEQTRDKYLSSVIARARSYHLVVGAKEEPCAHKQKETRSHLTSD